MRAVWVALVFVAGCGGSDGDPPAVLPAKYADIDDCETLATVEPERESDVLAIIDRAQVLRC